MTLVEAAERIGQKVVYRAPHGPFTEPGDEGVITSVNARYVFVRYGSDTGSKATEAAHLKAVAP